MKTQQSLIGAVIIIAGVALLAVNTGFEPLNSLAKDWWPMLIVALGIAMFTNSKQNLAWPLVIATSGIIIQLNILKLIQIDLGDLIAPFILFAIGAGIINSAFSRKPRVSSHQNEGVSAILGGVSNKNTSDNYVGSSATAIMGGVELDISKAVIKNEATIDVFALMGGVELRVPEDVIVKSNATVILGGIEDKTSPIKTKNAPVLYINGVIAMGGVEIKR
jgi:predicted membrane protein